MTLRRIVSDRSTPHDDRVRATELAGNIVVMNDDMADFLLSVLMNQSEPADLRGTAAIAMGPVLEECDAEGFEEDMLAEPEISRFTFQKIQSMLRETYENERNPTEVRRRALEAAVRSEGSWHADAIREAHTSNDPDWKLTAVFCMQYVRGFEKEILETLESSDETLERFAVIAAGNGEVKQAWGHVLGLLESSRTGKGLLLAAIEAAPMLAPEEDVAMALADLMDSDDEDIAETAHEALMMAGIVNENEDEEAEDDDPYRGQRYLQ